MITSLDKIANVRPLEADVVIIGGGAVGLTMLADRVRRGERTILVEAGGPRLDDRSQEIVRSAVSSGRTHEGVHIGRFRLLGGTTHFWGGQLGKFDPVVFAPRSIADGQHWPFEHGELAHWYDHAMSILGMEGVPDSDHDVCHRAGIIPPDAPALKYFFTRWLREPNLAVRFSDEIQSPNAQVILQANCMGFAPIENGRHEIAVRDFRGHEVRIRARAIVLACGTFEIVRLLQQPYLTGTPTPWGDNPWLGRAFYDHIDVSVGKVKIKDKKRFDSLFENVFLNGYKFNPKLKLTEETQRSKDLLQACGAFIFTTSYKENAANLRHFMRSLRRGELPENWLQLPSHIFAIAKVALPMVLRYLRSNRTFHPKNASITLRVTTEQIPIASSRIAQGDRRDALGMPVLDLHWAVDGREINTVAECAEAIKTFVEREGLATIELDPRIAARDRSLLDEGDDTNHQMGGARMAIDPSDGVVDPHLRVHGTRDIYVAGAATMPTSGFVNCTLTAVALGMRLNQCLRDQHA